MVELSVEKRIVYDAVAHTTAYLGDKSMDEGAFDRVFAKDDDRLILERYWSEACSTCTTMMRSFIVSVSDPTPARRLSLGSDYRVQLEMPSSFDDNLVGGMSESLIGFFTDYITGKWLELTGVKEFKDYILSADSHLMRFKTSLFHRRKPKRQPIN